MKMNNIMTVILLLIFASTGVLCAQKSRVQKRIEENDFLSSLYLEIHGSEKNNRRKKVDEFVNEILTAKYQVNAKNHSSLLQTIERDHFSKDAIDTLRKILFTDSLVNNYTIISLGYLGVREIRRFKDLIDSTKIYNSSSKSWAALIALGKFEEPSFDSIAISIIRKAEILTRYTALSKHLAYMNTKASFEELIYMLNSNEHFTDITNDRYPQFNTIYYASYLVRHLKKITINLPDVLVGSYDLELLRAWYNEGHAKRNKQAHVWIR